MTLTSMVLDEHAFVTADGVDAALVERPLPARWPARQSGTADRSPW